MEEEDNLAGYRRETVGDLSDDELAILSAIEQNKGLLETINAGVDVRRFMKTPAGRAILQRNEKLFSEAVAAWLSLSDYTSKEAMEAHYQARLSIAVLKEFQTTIADAVEVEEQQEQLTEFENMQRAPEPEDEDHPSMRESEDNGQTEDDTEGATAATGTSRARRNQQPNRGRGATRRRKR